MAYENKIAIESCIKKVHKEQGTIEKVESIINEIEEVYRKAKVLDEILNLPDTYGYAEDYAEDVDIILSEYMEDE